MPGKPRYVKQAFAGRLLDHLNEFAPASKTGFNIIGFPGCRVSMACDRFGHNMFTNTYRAAKEFYLASLGGVLIGDKHRRTAIWTFHITARVGG